MSDFDLSGKLVELTLALAVVLGLADVVFSFVRLCSRLRELQDELVLGLTSGWLSKIWTWRVCFESAVFTESVLVRFGMVTPERVAGFGGTPTLREVGGGDVDSCAWM